MLVHWLWLAQLAGISLRQKVELLRRFSDAEELYFTEKYQDIPPETVTALQNKDLTEAEQIQRLCARRNISILTYADEAYPRRLRNIPDPPVLLYYRGTLPDWESLPIICVVGTRKATPYGISAAKKLSRQIAACGGLVVSGGAGGIDTAAMQGAMDVGSPTVGVLGCGVDVAYPRSNRELFAKVTRNGCLFSEYPPGSRPEHWHFPQRNRILSGMANGVLVVEAPEKSGALITARYALEQGRDVFAVPGNIDAPTCSGSNALLQEGASAAVSGWDVLKEYQTRYPNIANRKVPLQREEPPQTLSYVAQIVAAADKKDIDNKPGNFYSGIEIPLNKFTEEETKLLACLTREPAPVDDVIAAAQLPSGRVLSLLTKLALQGVVVNHPGRMISVK